MCCSALLTLSVAVDVTFGGRSTKRPTPSPFGSMRRAKHAGRDHAQKLKLGAPDILVRPKVEHFGVLSSFRTSQILRADEGGKEEFRLALGERMKAHWAA